MVMNGGIPRWRLQANMNGSEGFVEHKVTWKDDVIVNKEDEHWLETGTGQGGGFVASLRRGDIIVVWAHYGKWKSISEHKSKSNVASGQFQKIMSVRWMWTFIMPSSKVSRLTTIILRSRDSQESNSN